MANKNFSERAAELAEQISENDPTTTDQAIALAEIYAKLAHAQSIRMLAAALRGQQTNEQRSPRVVASPEAENAADGRTAPQTIISRPDPEPFDQIPHEPAAETAIRSAVSPVEQLRAIYGPGITDDIVASLMALQVNPDAQTLG